MRNRARNDALDAGLAEQRQPLGRLFEPRRDAVEFGRDQLALEIPGWRVAVPADMGRIGLIGTDQHAVAFLAQIRVRPRIAHHRQFGRKLDQLLERLGDDVMVQHVGDRHIVTSPGPDDVAIATRRVDDVLAHDRALVGFHTPFAGWQPHDVGCPRTPLDLGAERLRTRCHGVRDIGRRDMAIIDSPERRFDAESLQIGVVFRDFAGPNDLALIADQLGEAGDALQPAHFLIGGREP
jgi:hypothetical protein